MMGAAFEIPYGANIGKGFSILHPCLGVVIHGDARCGENFQLAGGNVLGIKEHLPDRTLTIGNNVFVGVHAIILGPCTIGDNAIIGASSVVVKDVAENSVVAGNPAREIKKKIS